jgi:CHAT domain-containing protein
VGWKYRSVPISRDSLAALVEQFAGGIRAIPDVGGTRSRLFDLLIRPAVGAADGINRLAIVPDRELYRLAFSALWDSTTRGFLLERYELRTVPSAAYLVRATALPRGSRSRAPALVVGNPETHGALQPLPGATREATGIAGLYRPARLLVGAKVRRDSLLNLLPSSSVFHFSGHAIFNSEQPELSYLALTSENGDPGILPAWEIAGMRLSKMNVVVLSACSTLGPRLSRSGVTAGLAYSFLRAGAPATVSTLWDVDDRETTDLLVDFHERFAAGASVAESLRQAQLDALRSAQPSRRSPYTWAAFTYTGP